MPEGTRTALRTSALLYVYLLGPVLGGYSVVAMTKHSGWVIVLLMNLLAWLIGVLATPSVHIENQVGHGYLHHRAARSDVCKRRMLVGVLVFVGTAVLVSRAT